MKVSLPRADSPSTGHKGFAFCEYPSVETAQYAQALFSGTVRLFGRLVRFNYSPKGATASRCSHPIGRQGVGPHDSSMHWHPAVNATTDQASNWGKVSPCWPLAFRPSWN